MTWYADLETCTYFPQRSDRLLAVGWLERKYPYTRGTTDPRVIDRFAEFLVNQGRHVPGVFLGGHSCSFCFPDDERWDQDPEGRWQFGGGSWLRMEFKGQRIQLGIANLFIPGKGVMYVAPSLMLHYMVDHGYTPPQVFSDALLSCPPIGSEEYYDLFEQNGPHFWQEWARRRGRQDR
ncbi:MAG TPA: hypothetical protein VNL77_19880 [Roseiflexaceae bacterium]|nr:hypothetical protein [Roseiflexaceae bacterium]